MFDEVWSVYYKGVKIHTGNFDYLMDLILSEYPLPVLSFDANTRDITLRSFGDERSKSEIMSDVMNAHYEEKASQFSTYIDDPDYKFCWGCKRSKHVDSFGYRSHTKDKKSTRCKVCVNKQTKKVRKRRK